MKIILLLIVLILGHGSFGQTGTPREITQKDLQKIVAEVDKEAVKFKKSLATDYLSLDQIEFSVDTFKIQRIASKKMEIDYTTSGMNIAVDEMTKSYDKLMNKYYSKLLQLLKTEDKKILITAQKAWLAFRDAELKLIGTMSEEKYSGGGTIQSNIATGRYSDIIIKRTVDIFDYYDNVSKD